MRTSMVMLVLLALLTGLVVPAGAQDGGTLVDVLVSDADERFTLFVSALEAAGLAETLSSAEIFTLFAPTNDALNAWLALRGMTVTDLLADTDTLTAIMTYHLIPQAMLRADALTSGASFTSAQGEPLTVTADESGGLRVNDITVSETNLVADNGVLHVIDAVLVPSSVAAALAASDEETSGAHIRIAHFAPDLQVVDVYLNDELSDSAGLAYSTVTDWMLVPSGMTSVVVTAAESAVPLPLLGPTDVRLGLDTWTTLAIVDSPAIGDDLSAPPMLVPVLEDYSPIGEDNTRMTVFHALTGSPAVDLLLDDEIEVSNLAFPGTLRGNDGAFMIEVPAATYDAQVIISGTASDFGTTQPSTVVILDLLNTEFEPNTNYLVAIAGTTGAPEAIIVPTDMAALGVR